MPSPRPRRDRRASAGRRARRALNLYAESSAILAWCLGETRGEAARSALAGADVVMTSEISLIECDRALIRAVRGGTIAEDAAKTTRARLKTASAHWAVVPLQVEVVDRARQPFPHEPVRTLEAIHLATLVVSRALVPGLRVLSLDERIRSNAVAMGFEVVPT